MSVRSLDPPEGAAQAISEKSLHSLRHYEVTDHDIKRIYRSIFSERLEQDAPLLLSVFGLEGISVPSVSRLTPFDRIELMAVDPGTIALIIEATSLLIELFRGDDGGVAEEIAKVGVWVEKVERQLHRMNLLLEEIRDLLIDLKVLIRAEFTRAAENELLGYIQSYATNITAYKANPESTALQKLISDLYIPLQASARKLMNYGYAPAMTVFYAFRVEVDLVRLLKFGNEKQVAKDYFGYFDASLDETIPGSVANIIKSVASTLRDLEGRFTPGDKGFVGPAWWCKENCGERCFGGRVGECYYECSLRRIHPEYRITGSLREGFDCQLELNHIYNDSSKPFNEYLDGRARVLEEATNYLRANILPDYNKGCRTYGQLMLNAQALAETKKSCEQFREMAKRLCL